MTSLRLEGVTGWTGRRLPGGRIAETDAVLMRDGRIVALGAAARAAHSDEVIDATGQFLCPAFGDGHIHPIIGGLESQFAPIRDATSLDTVIAATKQWADDHPDEEWVRGDGLDITLAANGVFEAGWLDAVIPDRPVYLHGSDGQPMARSSSPPTGSRSGRCASLEHSWRCATCFPHRLPRRP
jgi:predicted amidohydrolase YtcJ